MREFYSVLQFGSNPLETLKIAGLDLAILILESRLCAIHASGVILSENLTIQPYEKISCIQDKKESIKHDYRACILFHSFLLKVKLNHF